MVKYTLMNTYVDFVRTTEYKICHGKFAAADTLTAWVNKNPMHASATRGQDGQTEKNTNTSNRMVVSK